MIHIARNVSHILIAILLIAPSPSLGDSEKDYEPWRQSQLNETFMRSLTKHQCVMKTIRTLKEKCRDNECIVTMGGVLGDCVEWASGEMTAYCADYDKKYIARYCGSEYLDAPRCALLAVDKMVSCDRARPTSDQKRQPLAKQVSPSRGSPPMSRTGRS